MRREHFGKLYEIVFGNLNAAQALLAIAIFRFVENERKRPTLAGYNFLPYSAHYIAMRLGCLLRKETSVALHDISHRNYKLIYEMFEQKKNDLYIAATNDVAQALLEFYGGRELSLQQLSATFRRGDLIERLICD